MGRQQLRNFPPWYLLQFSHLGSCFEFLPCLPEAFDQELGVVRWNKSFSPQLAFGQCLVTVAWMQTKAIRVLCVGAFPRLAESQPGAEFRSVLRINLLQGLISLRLLLPWAGWNVRGRNYSWYYGLWNSWRFELQLCYLQKFWNFFDWGQLVSINRIGKPTSENMCRIGENRDQTPGTDSP